MKLKLKKQTIRKLRRDKRVLVAVVIILVLAGVSIGVLSNKLRPYNQHPKNLVWAADSSITIPHDLLVFLQTQDGCKSSQSNNSSNSSSVSLWGVIKVSGDRFAKVSYGCSTTLTDYQMAVKDSQGWQLLDPTQYFGASGILPKCTELEKYHIPSSIESFCAKDDGSASANQQ